MRGEEEGGVLDHRWYRLNRIHHSPPFHRHQVVAQGHAATNDYVIVSAPGRNGEQGSVHIYTYSDSDEEWTSLQTVSGELWSVGKSKR